MSKPSWVFVIVEDAHHEMLVYRYLIRCGIGNREFRIEVSPSGQGSAEQWVRTRFVREMNAYRSRQARAATALIAMIDADTLRVQDRMRELDQALTESGKERVNAVERVARLIPKRNVETWLLCLNGHDADEETDYKRGRNDWSELIPPAAEVLFQWTRLDAKKSELPGNCVLSLENGVKELNRLGF